MVSQPRRAPYSLFRRSDGSFEAICCHFGGVSRAFGDSEREVIRRIQSYEALARNNRNFNH